IYPHLQDILEAGEQAAELTGQMLAYAGKGRFQVRRLDLGQLVRDVLGLVRSSLPAGVGLDVEFGDDLPPVAADSSQLQQLVMNLVINAGEAIGNKGGVIRIAVSLLQADEPVT